MNARELLKECRGALLRGQADEQMAMVAGIDAHLAAPSESAMEMVRRLREEALSTKCRNCGADERLHNWPSMQCPKHGRKADVGKAQEWDDATFDPCIDFSLALTDAAALIEGLQRSVPSALFDEIIEIQPLSYAKLGRAFVKHGVRCEP